MPDEARVLLLLEELMDSRSTPEEVCREYPELLPEVRERWHRLRRVDAELEALFPSSGPTSHRRGAPIVDLRRNLPQIPGYEMESVLGHGGVGVVYKARHLKLKRTVALKMLLAGDYAGARELARFRREAEAVAGLRHPNIVQVYDVGDFDERPYFTMEYVEGGDLARTLAGMPQPAQRAASMVATLAGAVQAAHAGGIVHRDLKPANILVTDDGTLKISDFGLAWRFEGDPALTLSCAKVGTPSYMAPEQAIGRATAFCPSVDIYSLGALLYEMLTGRPPFRAETAAETQRQVMEGEPAPPSRLNAKVPRDLETICLKCLHREPHRRYSSAAALAEDLQRFERGEPIHARRVGRLERSARWMRRNPTGAALIFTALALLGVAVGFGMREWSIAAQRRAETAKWAARLEFVFRLQREGRFTEARAILGRETGADCDELRPIIERAQTELELVERLEAIRADRASSGQRNFDKAAADLDYQEAFKKAGLGAIDDPPARIAERIAAMDVRNAVVAGLDDWAYRATDKGRLGWLLDIARRVDPDPQWRDKVRDPALWTDAAALSDLARTAAFAEHSVPLLLVLGGLLEEAGGDAVEFFRGVQKAHPSDFWANFSLAETLDAHGDADAIGYYRAAMAIRPQAVAAYVNLGMTLSKRGRLPEAMDYWRAALKLNPESAMVHINLAIAAINENLLDEAIYHSRETIRLDPQSGHAHAVLGQALLLKQQPNQAQATLRRAVELLPQNDPMRALAVQSLERCEKNAGEAVNP